MPCHPERSLPLNSLVNPESFSAGQGSDERTNRIEVRVFFMTNGIKREFSNGNCNVAMGK
jgi:hypothetical protein